MKKIKFIVILILFLPLLSCAQQKFMLEDFVKSPRFSARSVYGLRSMKDGEHYSTINFQSQKIEKFAYKTWQLVETILDFAQINLEVSDYQFSADESKILLETNVREIYRRSFLADYYVYDLKSKKLEKLTDVGSERLASFSPDAQNVAFMVDNNLFYKNLTSEKIVQISVDGKQNEIINGAPDWVYEEEFGYNQAFAWSPDGKKLAYCKFDERNVHEYGMDVFAGAAPRYTEYETYPGRYVWKYPKAGENNSLVSVHIFMLLNSTTVKADVGKETDQYIPRIKWTNNPDQLLIYRLNRLQNHLEFLAADAKTGQTKLIYTDKNQYYVDDADFDKLEFVENGFIVMSERDGWSHLYYMDMDGKVLANLSPGNFDVTDYLGYDAKNKLVYYQAAVESPMEREVYAVSIKGGKVKKLSTLKGTNNASFSSSFQYFINDFSSVSIPPLVTLHDANGKQIRILEDNQMLKDRLKQYHFQNKEFIKIPVENGIELNAWILKPANFDASKKYPLMITQYSGPNSQQVLNRWSMGWEYLLAQDSILVVSVDPRGTGARGEAFRKATYKQLGKYESDDMVAAARYLAGLNFVNAKKMAIWGWSYGGFMTLLAMSKGDGVFSAGISVAPVTNWRFYDNIYTERFMRTPLENAAGYDENSPINMINNLQGNLFLIHGLADDNVHFQNSAEYIAAAIEADKHLQVMIYPNKNHGIYGGNTRWYLYTQMYRFLLNELK